MPIQLVLSDLDGTLLAPDRTISDEAVAMIGALKARGVGFSFITGRPLFSVQRFLTRVSLTDPVIVSNGALIVHNGRVLSRHSALLAPARPLMELADRLGWTVLYYANFVESALRPTAWVKERLQKGRSCPVNALTQKDWETLQVEKINLIANGAGGAAELEPLTRQAEHSFAIVRYGAEGMELTPLNVTKANALEELARLTGVPVRAMLAIGDGENDVEMLLRAGVGAAVANAVPAAKASADYVCKASYTRGVLEAIRHFCGEA